MSVKLQQAATPKGKAPAANSPPKSAAAAAAPAAKPAATGTGELYVDSRPRGARVLVDGKEFGLTPLRVPALSIGSHTVLLELADHSSWTNTAKVTGGDTTRVTGSLERIR